MGREGSNSLSTKHPGRRLIKSAGIGALAGIIAGLSMTIVMLVLRWCLGIATPAELVGDRLAPTFTPGEFLGLLQRFGGYNRLKQLGVGSVLMGQVAVATLGGIIYAAIVERQRQKSPEPSRRFDTSRQGAAFALCFVLLFSIASIAWLWPVLSTSFIGLRPAQASLTTAAGFLVAYSVYGAALMAAHRYMTGARGQGATAAGRRRLFITSGIATVAAALTAGLLNRLYRLATFSYDGTQYIGPEVEPITPNDRFYTVTKNVIDPHISKAVWRLEVGGMVDRPRTYAFEDLKSFASVIQETTLMCISNWVGGGLMSNAIWKGVPLAALIEAAGPRTGQAKVLFRAVDGYTDTISLEKAMDPSTIVAFEMNGDPLPEKHGYPARIIVPGMFGEKNVKWVTRIELAGEEAKGFYEQQGWGPSFLVPIRSRFDFPYYDQTIPMAPSILLKGIAFGGDRGVSNVEVSLDGGGTWQQTRIDYAGARLAWALWSYDWRPERPGDYILVVRAIDLAGDVQTAEERGTVPEGATGYHRVMLRLTD